MLATSMYSSSFLPTLIGGVLCLVLGLGTFQHRFLFLIAYVPT
jgi:hypothetical protein